MTVFYKLVCNSCLGKAKMVSCGVAEFQTSRVVRPVINCENQVHILKLHRGKMCMLSYIILYQAFENSYFYDRAELPIISQELTLR